MKKHVLLIDEDRAEIKNFTNALADISRSYKCTYASSVWQGLEMLRFLEPDIIVADYNQEGTDGLQFLSVIKKDPRQRKASVFLYAESMPPDVKERAESLGVCACIESADPVGAVAGVLKSFVMNEQAA